MFVLDTNVLSALIASRPPERVASWISLRSPSELFTTTICQAEILSGLAVMSPGRRRAKLFDAARAMFMDDFEGRVLDFDMAAAVDYAELFAERRRVGRPAAMADLMIAAIARVHSAAVVTRNVADFDVCGIAVVDPWSE